MAKTREIVCIYYDCEGSCLKGRKGTFWKECQTCAKYSPRKGGSPARKNLKKQKMNEIQKSEMKKMIRNNDY